MISLLVNTIEDDLRKSCSKKKKKDSGLSVFSFREKLPELSKSQRKFIQTIPRVNHGPLKKQNSRNIQSQGHSQQWKPLITSNKTVNLHNNPLLGIQPLSSSHLLLRDDAFNKHVYKPVICFWHYFCPFLHQTSFMGREH